MAKPGDPSSMQRLVDEHYVSLYRYAFRLSGSAADAEDLVQETFVKAQQKLSQLREASREKPWLFSILRNDYLHRHRSEKQHPQIPLDDVGDVAEGLPDELPEIDPEQLQVALNELPEVFRTPIILFYFEEFGYREIAAQMDLPIGTVMSRLARAKAHLRQRLLPFVDEPAGTSGATRRANNGV